MAKTSIVKVLEHCKISPPPLSDPNITLPLTLFDIPWLFFSPTQPLFFYDYHFSTSHFLSTTLPTLKQSLSLTLQHFFPFAGNLVLSSHTNEKPKIVCTEFDFVSLTVAESDGDFTHLTGNHPRDVTEFHSLVPDLKTSSVRVNEALPLFAVKVTIFSTFGLCIGLAYHHVVADGRTFNNFIKTWASFCKDSCFLMKSFPSYDRNVIVDRNGLGEIFWKEWFKRKEMVIGSETEIDLPEMARATFVVSLNDMERIKKWIIAQCKKRNWAQPVHLSPYVLTCSFVWVCLIKSFIQDSNEKCLAEDPSFFGFNAGGLSRLDYSVPAPYFGNCIGFGRSMTRVGELLGEDGIIIAANSLGNTIKKLDKAMFEGAEKWISDWEVLFGSYLHVMVCGSPKVDLYKTDFGWGRPKKIEEISIEKRKAVSLTESRDFEGGIEVGIALPKSQMDAFNFLFNQGLKVLP
ncbi:anthocyanin 5-aromatic acyltransferase-like [Pistacia vera]|uniref:anthocyanin 5-aromatic acyltransferase-like n=1 Tax=Pistacia vera TaxID=55513 RepID=UPI001262D80D|nr:anthocyanin 5-aromatic acyltransferase-like [Pistacia vera]